MPFDLKPKLPGDLIKSEEWNKILDEISGLRARVDGLDKKAAAIASDLDALKSQVNNMTRIVTLTSLENTLGHSLATSYGLKDSDERIDYGVNAIGLITRQYYARFEGDICSFGIDDYADVIYYWAAAAEADHAAYITISLNYSGSERYDSDVLFINGWNGKPPFGPSVRNKENSYIDFLVGGEKVIEGRTVYTKFWYKYAIENPIQFKNRRIISITFRAKRAARIANVLQYGTTIINHES